MRTKKRVLPALLVSLFAGVSAPAADAAQFSGVYVFGDSLSDAGFYRPFLAGLGLPAPLVSTLGRFTTNPGPVWSEIVSSYYGYTPAPSNVSGGNIFAQGGARVAADSASTPPGFAQRPVSVQINEFLARGGGSADPNALYSVWAGGNDFLQNFAAYAGGAISATDLQNNVLAAATAEIGQIARLRNAGARYIIVFQLPDVGSTPFAAGAGAAAAAAATQLSAGYNTTLFTGLASQGIRVIPVDMFALFADIKTNASAYGITNLTGMACGPFPPITTTPNSQFCYSGNLVAPNADRTYLFADSVHPTSITHQIIGDFVKSLIDGPSQYSMLPEASLRAREAHVRSLSDGIASARHDPIGGWNVFVGGDAADYDVEKGQGLPELKTTSRALTLGVTVRASDSVVAGIAYGGARNRGTFGSGAGDYQQSENTWSLFAAAKAGWFYGAGVLSLGDTSYSNIHRNITLANVKRVAEGSTEGTNGSAYLTAGMDFPMGNFQVGPLVSVMTQNLNVNQFDEASAGAANLRIMEQKRKSEVWSAGARASYRLGDWTPWARITADKERRDDDRVVTAMPLSMAAIGSSYDIPAYKPDSSYWTWSLGVNGMVMQKVGLSLSYYRIEGRTGIKEDGFSGMVSIGF